MDAKLSTPTVCTTKLWTCFLSNPHGQACNVGILEYVLVADVFQSIEALAITEGTIRFKSFCE
jgi:hypothetical protein